MFYKLGRAGRALKKLGAIDFATTIAPGVRDVLLTGKVKEAVTRTEDGRRGLRRGGARRPADRPDRPLPQRHAPRPPGWPRSARSRRQSEGVAAVLRSPVTVGARGDAARGDAGTGDGRRGGRTAAARPPGRHDHRQRHPAAAAGQGQGRPRPTCDGGWSTAGLPSDRDVVAGLVDGGPGAPGPARGRGRAAQASSPRSVGRWSTCRRCRTGSTWPGSTSSPGCCSRPVAERRARAAAGLGSDA